MKMTSLEKLFVNRPGHAGGNLSRLRPLLREIDLRPGMRVLEIGSGDGQVARELADQFDLDITGIDVDPAQTALAQKLMTSKGSVRFVTADAAELPFDGHSFEMVLSLMVFHHISRWREAVREIGRVITPGGRLIIRDFALPRWVRRRASALEAKYGVYTLDELSFELRSSGFQTSRVRVRNRVLAASVVMVAQKWPVAAAGRPLTCGRTTGPDQDSVRESR